MEIIRGRQHPDEPIMPPLGPLGRLEIVELPAGQTAAERVKAILDAAGFGVPEPPAPVETCGLRVVRDGETVFVCTEPPHPDTPYVHTMLDGHREIED